MELRKKGNNQEPKGLFTNSTGLKCLEDPVAKEKKKKNFLALILKGLVSFSLLFYLGSKLSWDKFFSYCQTLNPWMLFLSFFFCAFQTLLSSLRWKILLTALNTEIKIWTAFQLAMIGKFFNALLPGGTSGDLLRIYYALKLFPGKKTAMSVSIIFDRFIEGVVLLVLGSIFGLLFYNQLAEKPLVQKAVLFLLLLTVLTLIFLASLRITLKGSIKLSRFFFKKTKGLETVLEEILLALDAFKNAYCKVFFACILSMGVHLAAILMFVFVAFSLHMQLPLWLLIVVMVEITLVVSLPISISGLGVREGSVLLLLGSYGISPELAVGFSLLSFAIGTLWSLVGGVFFLTWKKDNSKGYSFH
ncbi:lysylphosphatidylglycerol synthase transmembrane domain-containing protein [Candidatus Methylacidiphilum infernorum]|uniref:lysylphosphatidylglycerol synthase transmembrane domain-containing protein n=1 Tax=Candidatus Methylacidiphilum infernorum TaxID=511746 RepID=UPI0002E616A5|nr:lysylphosphatidylglycerol synthase transmembrane domain-containing protein [Candidatus Methylacidiphilum infernorum]